MQIQLKQTEIVAALAMYVTAQGINLTGKNVNAEFTAGRKNSGLSVELTIEDENASKATSPVMHVVTNHAVEKTDTVTDTHGNPEPAVTIEHPAPEADATEQPAAAPTTSLFAG